MTDDTRFDGVSPGKEEKVSDWTEDCIKWRGRILSGPYSHWCADWDDLPVNFFTPEFSTCACYSGPLFRLVQWLNRLYWWMARTTTESTPPPDQAVEEELPGGLSLIRKAAYKRARRKERNLQDTTLRKGERR